MRGQKMVLGDTKYGITILINKEQCQKLGFGLEQSTKEIIKN